MPRTCTICHHDEREAIDAALVSGVAHRAIANQWHVGRAAVQRHAKNHLSAALVATQADAARTRAKSILDRMERTST